MSQNQQHNHFSITHQSGRQIKIITPSLFNNQERAIILQTVLLMREAIEKVEIEIEKNSVTINYNPDQLPKQNLLPLLEVVLNNFSQRPQNDRQNDNKKILNKSDIEETITFKIRGMSCNSCALFLEMVLSRNLNIMLANISYKSKTGIVKGYLKQEKVIQIIEKNGYQAYCVDVVTQEYKTNIPSQ